jgi:hypothetical protein
VRHHKNAGIRVKNIHKLSTSLTKFTGQKKRTHATTKTTRIKSKEKRRKQKQLFRIGKQRKKHSVWKGRVQEYVF